MSIENIKYFISIAAIILLLLHIFLPNLGIDVTTIALLFISVLPFAGSLLKALAFSGIKKLELPGGIKIELSDAKAATDKVIRGWGNLSLPPLKVSGIRTVSKSDDLQKQIPSEDPILRGTLVQIQLDFGEEEE
jgi:hypothetical protein